MEENTRVAIIGYGFVGTATEYLLQEHFAENRFNVEIHDPDKGHVIKASDWKGIEYAFICVPTNLKEGLLDTSIIDNILSTLYVGTQPVIRSTIGPEQALQYAKKGCIIMPEFLREKHWKEDVDNPNIDIVIGARQHGGFVDLMSQNTADKMVKHATPMEASMMKMMRNAALAVKVGLANEFNEICNVMDIDYEVLKIFLEEDENLGGTHWAVPGPDSRVGFGGTCLPKDLTHASSLCYNTHSIMKTAIEANKSRRK